MSPIAPVRFQVGRPMLLAGIRQRHPFVEMGRGMPEQWTRFMAMGPLPGQQGISHYGVLCGSDADSVEYMCAVEVAGFDGLPAGLGRMRIQAQDYAVFDHTGHVTAVQSTWQGIFEWLSSSAEHMSAQRPDFEVYDAQRFDPATGLGGFEIWVAVRRRQGAVEPR